MIAPVFEDDAAFDGGAVTQHPKVANLRNYHVGQATRTDQMTASGITSTALVLVARLMSKSRPTTERKKNFEN